MAGIGKIIRERNLNIWDKAAYLLDLFWFKAWGMKKNVSGLFGYDIHSTNSDALMHLVNEIFVQLSYYVPIRGGSPIIFDIGGNIGIATLFFKKIFPHSTVYCFEPDPQTFTLLQRNIIGNKLNNVFSFNAGVSDFSGTAKLYVPPWSNGSSSLFQEKIAIEAGYADRCQPGITLSSEEKDIAMMRCSEFIRDRGIEHIDLMKIDAEGAEERIFNDLRDSLGMIDMIIFEHHYAKDFLQRNSLARIIAILEEAGFVVSTAPAWFTSSPQVMCTYMVKAVNGRCTESSALLQGCKE